MTTEREGGTAEAAPLLLTLSEAAAQLGICERTLRGYVNNGALAHIAFGHGTVRRRRRMIHPDDLRDFIDRQRVGGLAASPQNPAAVAGAPRRRSGTPPLGPGGGGFLALLAAEREQKAKGRDRE